MNNVSNNNNNTTTNNNNFPSSLLKFNIQNLEEENEISNLVDVHNNDNVEINNKIGNINYYKYEGMENMDIVNFNSFEFENNNNRVMDNESSNIEMSIQEHNILSKNLRNVEFKNNETENNFYINRRNEMDIRMYQRNNIMNNMNYIYDNNLVWNGNNEKCENYWGNGNTEKCESWDNYLGFEKEKTFNSEKDYFKIFNYGMCNNIGNKFNYCDPHKNQINKYDNSLFIL